MSVGLGSGEHGEFTFLDMISIISFVVGLQNLEMNITQEDMDSATRRLDNALKLKVDEIHAHLEQQDMKIDRLLELIERSDHA